MIAGSVFTNIFGLATVGGYGPERDEQVRRIGKAAAAAGFAIVLCHSGQKIPMCPLTARQAKTADKAASEEAGRKTRHACGIAHASTTPAEVARWLTRWTDVNIGVELGASRHLVVDTDTAEQTSAFLAAWSAATGTDQSGRTPTVLSPGAQRSDGTWAHSHGGHFWFSLPEGVDTPAGQGVWTAPEGWAAIWRDHQVLVPPSVRSEGSYRCIGVPDVAPDWLLDLIGRQSQAWVARRSAAASRTYDQGDPLERWSADTPWSDLLDGWTATSLVDSCGCPVFTAPGEHASPKSATAHTIGCARYDTATGWGPLHIWTDNPPPQLSGSRTWTKVQVLAALRHDGDQRSAMVEAGIIAPDTVIDGFDCEEPELALPIVDDDDDDDDQFDLGDAPANAAEVAPDALTANSVTLPMSFWSKRPSLKHVFEAAMCRMCSPDALLMATLARISALRDSTITLDIGLGTIGLNLIVCPVGPSSSGKGIAMAGANQLVPLPAHLVGCPDGVGLGSGEGVAEAFMGKVQQETGQVYVSGPNKGTPKYREVRTQVRSNAFFGLDEGQTLGKMGERAGATIYPALRSAWSCATIGQANAREETTRSVPAGSYSAGFVLAFQPETASAVLEDTSGLAQRALWVSALHPAITAEEGAHPGPLSALLTADPLAGGGVMTFPAVIRTAYRVRRAAVARGDVSEDPLDGHGPLVRAKVACLLALLDGRGSVDVDDWRMAGVVWATSCRLRSRLMETAAEAAREAARARAVLAARPLVLAARQQLADVDARVERVAGVLATRVGVAGELTHKAARGGCRSTDRSVYEDARDFAEAQGWIKVGDGVHPVLTPGEHVRR